MTREEWTALQVHIDAAREQLYQAAARLPVDADYYDLMNMVNRLTNMSIRLSPEQTEWHAPLNASLLARVGYVRR